MLCDHTCNSKLFGFGLGIALLVAALAGNLPSVANAHESEHTPVVAQEHGVDMVKWCAHGDGAENPSAGHGAHCFAPAFASFNSADQVSWFAVDHTPSYPTEEAYRHGLTVGAEPPPPRITS